jgi:regulator of protease activity HflC (stomatin/prohibitin superfamily)
MQTILAALVVLVVGYTIGSVKIMNQGNEALVERLGRYHRKLTPGLNFIVPILDTIVWQDTTREQVIDIPPQEVNTKDNITLKVDAVVYWRILELERTYYAVEDIDEALSNLVMTTLRAEIGQLILEETYASRARLNDTLLRQLDDATTPWGVKVLRVEVQNINIPERVRESLEQERAAQSRKRAAISEAEGRKQALIEEAEGTVESIRKISEAMGNRGDTSEVLRYLLAQKYVDANYRLGASNNSKIVFMDPKALTEAMTDLISSDPTTFSPGISPAANPNPNPPPNPPASGSKPPQNRDEASP